jgi:ABC-type polysaccharide/polyol phosphate export systems, permease component
MTKTIIEPNSFSPKQKLKELYQYRELLFVLSYRDFRVRYAQTFIGIAWALINPIATVFLLTFVFGIIAKVDTGKTPHALYTIAGMCGWNYFSAIVGQAGGAIIGSQNMIKKIYFPRLILPLSKSITALVDFLVVIFCLILMMGYYGIWPSANLIYFPFFVLAVIISGLTGGIWISCLTIRYRDFQHIVPFLLRLGMFITPIAFPASSVPEQYKLLFFLNPMAGIVEGIRWSILGGTAMPSYLWVSLLITLLLFVTGVFYFLKVERIMADII